MIPDFYGWLTGNAALVALLGGQNAVYPNVVPEGKNAPAVVYQTFGGSSTDYLAEVPGADHTWTTVTAWAVSPAAARNIANAARNVLEQRGYIRNPSMDFDPDTNWHAVRFEVSIWGLR